MAFDQNWEATVYGQGKQFNRYPFDWVVSTVHRLFRDRAVLPATKVIELGCGTGNNLKFLLDFGFGSVDGIEGSQSALNFAKQNVVEQTDRLNLIHGDFRKIPAADGCYSLVLDRGSITHNDPQSCREIVNEAFRVLKPGGFMASVLFSNLHSSLHRAEPIGPSFYKAFRDEIAAEEGLFTSFLSMKDLLEIFERFEIVSCVSDVKTEFAAAPYVNAMWYVIARKPA